MRDYLKNVYIDFVNNYLTIEVFAEHNGLNLSEANQLIEVARSTYYNQHPEA